MARSRLIRPEFFNDPEFSKLSIGARHLFIALLPHMDRNGIMLGDPQTVRCVVFPCDAKMRRSDVKKWLAELHKLGRIIKFTHKDTEYVLDPHFGVHQNIYSTDPDIYRIGVEIRSRVIRDWTEEQRQLNLHLLNLNPNLNLNQEADQNGLVDNSAEETKAKSGQQGGAGATPEIREQILNSLRRPGLTLKPERSEEEYKAELRDQLERLAASEAEKQKTLTKGESRELNAEVEHDRER